MEESATLKNRTLANQVQDELVGKVIKGTLLMKLNSENLLINGEISFPVNLLAWRGLIQQDVEDCSDILEYYLRRKKFDTVRLSKQDILKKATESLVIASEQWPMTIARCTLQRDRVCLFLERRRIIESAIREALRHGIDYGRRKSTGKSIRLKINEDKDSDLTTVRLRLTKEVSEQVLCLRGFEIIDTDTDCQYLLTTKSQGPLEDGYQRHVCGVVKNKNSNSKETLFTWSTYVDRRIQDLASLVEVKLPESSEQSNLQNIAQAVVTFELLSVKPSRPVFIRTNEDPDKRISSSRGGSFVLYNAARITAILQRFKEEECLGYYPSLPDIDNVDFTQLIQEEEWELVYNFILGYPEMIDNCVRNEAHLETSPQTICLFLSRLSQKFSVYYRRTRILTKGRDHLVPAMMARLYLLRALQVVINNSLVILNISPVSHM